MESDPSLQDPLLSLRRAIAAGSLPTPMTSSDPSDQNATDNLAKATYLFFQNPSPQTIPLNASTRFFSTASDSAVDLRSIFFAWQKKDVAIPDYIASAQELNESLKQKERKEGEEEEQVQNLVFVERLDLITWLEGASDESEYIKPLEGAAAAAASAVDQAQASANIASGAAGGVSAVPSGAPGTTAPSGGAQQGKTAKVVDPRLQEIYNGERKMGDRNSVLRGIKPTDFSHVRKTAETFLGRNRSRTGQYPPGAKPGSKPQSLIPAPSAGLPQPRKGSSKTQDPIILLSPSASSLIRMSNVRSFLQDGVFVPPDHPTLSMPSSNILYISRPLRILSDPSNTTSRAAGSQTATRKPTRFILVDSTANFRPDYWNRLVAVFTTGQTWQFKSYKWSSPPELFKHASGIHVGWRGEGVPREVRGWGRGVQSFSVERWDEKGGVNGAGRWRDREVVEGIWTAIEEGMKQRGWGNK
ncbi:pol II transcription elongation factor subunit Cdc73 [Aspergillus bombycis]|uniref:Pol II transcription elongation factor subunit Cdc73 n=1 Tax=Aspergillus bombycis TaxID=109264 RepID=A0A1F7ZP53_9EURO|nr:pol II transcription elongation factor subunit Cdc73 [Aspergillus bombycis]OGM41223.1 pol II transcription elongation factor subunit Cdc73 [Aspergillus bombycis]